MVMTPQEHEGNKKLANFMQANVCNTYEDHVLYDYSTARVLRNFDEPLKGDNYPDNFKRYHASTSLKYHSDWNWIHDTFGVFKKLIPNLNSKLDVLDLNNELYKLNNEMAKCFFNSDKEEAFNTLLEYVDFYNKNVKQ
jgi:hypothetical protein